MRIKSIPMEEILFTKMHGIGNDYLYINCLSSIPGNIEDLAISMSHRHTGVGSDGIILILPSEVADFRMRIFNADGSEARMCGNGSRCVGKYVWDYGLTDSPGITLETLAGIRHIQVHFDDRHRVCAATVDMGVPSLVPAEIPADFPGEAMIEQPIDTSRGEFRITAVSMGNPHGVVFIDELTDSLVLEAGAELERHSIWPDRANIEFARIIAPDLIEMRVWERGSGETMACGTGACATAVAAMITGRSADRVTVRLLGGDLIIERRPDGHILMTGPAATVCEGRYFRNEPSTDKSLHQ